jgi:integrase
LMRMAARGLSRSAIGNVRTYLKSALEFALDIELISKNPARGAKLVIPRALAKREKRVLSEDQARSLLAHAQGRERVILRLFLVGGLRAQELFALRADDVTAGRLRIDEAIKSVETGDERIGEPKTEASGAYAAVPPAIERELRNWIAGLPDQSPRAWLFPSEVGTPIRPDNYLKRTLKPLAASVGIPGITFQILRRTCATLMDSREHAQAQLRHTTPETTARHYRQAIPAEVRESVANLDQRLTATDRQRAVKDGVA